jgi:ABC-type nitrate/sulfonate/bicarbonate transport system substrate-binding protein
MKSFALVLCAVAALASAALSVSCKGGPAESQPTQVNVRFGMLPYGDHTYAIIGVQKGWFRDVGINLDYRVIKVDEAVSYLRNGSLDVASCPPGVIFAANDSNPGVVSFVFGSVFQGYGIMARPDPKIRSFSEFVASGLSSADALKAAVSQMRSKTFAYPSEAAIKPFIDLVLKKGGLSRNDFHSLVQDDPLTVNAMRNGQADFQVGGAPSRVLLERDGFKPILTSNDLARAAEPSPNSPELASVFTDGWATTRAYYAKNHDTILRLSAVHFRITRFMNERPGEALTIHMQYLTQATGQPFSAADGKVIYNSLDPFFTFEAERPWYHDPHSTYYFRNLNGALINSFIAQGVYKKPPPTVDDVIVAADVYYEMERLKAEADALFARIQEPGLSPAARANFEKAKEFYANYNYLDARNLARDLVSAGK